MRTSLFTHKCLPSIQKTGVWLLAYGLSLRRLSFSVFFFATFVVFLFFPYFSSAQIEAPSETRASQASGAASGLQNYNTMSQSAGGNGVATLPPAQQANAPAQPAKEDTDLIDKAKEVASTVTAITNLPEKILNFFTTLFLSVASALLYVAGMAFESTLEFLVFGMGELIQNKTGLGNAIDTMWRLIRDIANIIFIYAFVYIGIMLIVDPDKVSVKQLLARTIIGALLINFSLFFVKFIIDFANFTTLQIFNAFTTGSGSISAKVTDMLGVGTLMNPGSADRFADLTGGGMFWFFILGGILILIVAFVFFAATFMMMSRFVWLVIIMIASPILFAGTIFSGTQSFANDLWKKLISYAFYAPAFLLLIFIAITLLSGLGTEIVPNGAKLGDALLPGNAKPPTKDMFAIIVNFFVVIFFFIQALVLAQKLGVFGGDMTVKIANDLRGKAQSLVGRTIVGHAAHYIKEKYEDADAEMRKTKGGRILRGALTAVTFGAASDRSIRKTLESGEHAKFGGSYSYEDDEKYAKDYKARDYSRAQQTNLEQSVVAGHSAPAGAAGNATRIAMERSIAGTSTEQLQKLLKEYEGEPEYDTIVKNMSASQIDAVLKAKPEDFSEEKKEKLKAERTRVVQTKYGVVGTTSSTPGMPGTIGKASGAELDAMDFNTVIEHAGQLSMKQIDSMKSIENSVTAKKDLIDARDAALITEFRGPAGPATLFGRITNDTEISKLPVDILKDPAASEYLTVGALGKIPETTEGKISPTELIAIKNSVLGYHHGGSRYDAFDNFFKKSPAGNRFG